MPVVVILPNNNSNNNSNSNHNDNNNNNKEGPPDEKLYEYIVEFKSTVDVDKKVKYLEQIHKGVVKYKYKHAVKGYVCKMSKHTIGVLLEDKDVLHIERDGIVNIAIHEPEKITIEEKKSGGEVNSNLLFGEQWNQTITNAVPKLTDDFSSIDCYIVDTGILPTHQEFYPGQVVLGLNAITNAFNSQDNNGHGTAVASVVAGINVGIAVKTSLIAVKVLGQNGSGYYSDVIQGLDWIVATRNRNNPSIINMSLGGCKSTTLNNAVQNCITNGITVVVAAGNSGSDASNYSPSSTGNALTVSAHDINKTRPSWANYGSVVDFFAPGVSITSAWFTSPTSYSQLSGTSLASPIACGIAVRFLATGNYSPYQVKEYFTKNDIYGEIINQGSNSPNQRVYLNTSPIPCVCP